MGSLTQEDPIGIAGGLNLYGYANGDPINFSDPFGLMACDEESSDEDAADCEDRAAKVLAFIRSGLRKMEHGLVRNSRCIAATSNAAAVVAGDASFFLGVGAVAKAGVLAYGNGRVAATLARQEVTRDLAPAAVARSQSFVGVGLDTGARTGLSQAGGSAGANTAAAYGGSRVGPSDWVPGFASVRAIGNARGACGA